MNCLTKCLRRFGLREEDMTLDKLLSKARALEASETQASGIENFHQEVPGGERVNWVMPKNLRQPPPRKDNMCRKHGHTRRVLAAVI